MTFDIGTGTPWRIPNDGLENMANLDYSLETSANVLADGSAFVSSRVEEVDRTFNADYWGPDPDGARAEAIGFFNHRYTFSAHVSYRGRTRWCEGRIAGFEAKTDNVYKLPQISATLLCLDPYLRSGSFNENSLTDAAPMFGFPFVSHTRRRAPDGAKKPVGFLASKRLYDGLNTVYNSGDVPTQCVIKMVARGHIESPTFTKDDKHITVMSTFEDGDVLSIDFTQAPPAVEINGKNSIQMCSRDSDFVGMGMQVGANVFNYDCANRDNRPYMDVKINFYRKYLGV